MASSTIRALAWAGALALLSVHAQVSFAQTAPAQAALAARPNIIVTLTDDQGYNDVGCYGKYEQPDAKIPPTLYNLETDIGEQKTLLRFHPEIVKQQRHN